jgi:hypothetical protein|nr:MAG TPA: hypothetical protein [Caudoviricetes sp.]
MTKQHSYIFFNAPVPNNYHVITSRSLSESDKNEV